MTLNHQSSSRTYLFLDRKFNSHAFDFSVMTSTTLFDYCFARFSKSNSLRFRNSMSSTLFNETSLCVFSLF